MIIRREIIHFAIKNNLLHLLSVNNEKSLIDKLGRQTLEKAKKPFGNNNNGDHEENKTIELDTNNT